MERVFAVMLDPLLPIFAVLVLGFCLSLAKVFEAKDAGSINRFVFYLAVPSLIFSVLVKADVGDFQWKVLSVYFLAEIVIYAVGTLIARSVFGFTGPEALLLGMTACFSNHILFVLPIALQLYGEPAGLPIAAIVTADAALVFGLTIFAMEFMTNQIANAKKVASQLVQNPMIIAIVAGILINLSGVTLPSGMITFTDFTGAAAAPVALFALGILLARSSPWELEPVAIVVTLLQLAAFPALLWLGFQSMGIAGGGAGLWPESTLLVAAGPCGAMPFVLAMRYGVRPDAIAKAIVYSTTLSMFTLAWIA